MEATPKEMFCRGWSFSEDTLQKCLTRYTGFGRELYEMIRDQIPDAFSRLTFYRSQIHQAADSYAICGVEPPFSIQLDPDCEVIVLGGENVHTEIGAWATDPCDEAIKFIREHLIGKNKDGAEQPATAPDSKSEGSEKPKLESEGRSQ